jgi:hypothetical protein
MIKMRNFDFENGSTELNKHRKQSRQRFVQTYTLTAEVRYSVSEYFTHKLITMKSVVFMVVLHLVFFFIPTSECSLHASCKIDW